MTRRLGLIAFVASVVCIGAAYASAFLPGGSPGWAPWALAFGSCVSLVAMMVVGAAREGRVGGRLSLVFLAVLLLTAGGFALLLALPPADPNDPTLFLGLPPRAAVVLYGIGLVPFFFVPVAYARTFDAVTLTEGDLERVRAAAKATSTSTSRSPAAAAQPRRRELEAVGARFAPDEEEGSGSAPISASDSASGHGSESTR